MIFLFYEGAGAGGLSSRVILAIVVPLGVVAALSLGYYCLCRGEVKKSDVRMDSGMVALALWYLNFLADVLALNVVGSLETKLPVLSRKTYDGR